MQGAGRGAQRDRATISDRGSSGGRATTCREIGSAKEGASRRRAFRRPEGLRFHRSLARRQRYDFCSFGDAAVLPMRGVWAESEGNDKFLIRAGAFAQVVG